MRSFFAYLLFCFYCLGAAIEQGLPFKTNTNGPDYITRPALFLSVSVYFFAAGLLAFALRMAGIELPQSYWVPAFVVVTFLANYLFTQYYLRQGNRGLLLLEHYAPLVHKNKWLYPATGLLFFLAGFAVFITGASQLLSK